MMNSDFPKDTRKLIQRLEEAVPPHSDALGDAGDDPLLKTAQRLANGPDIKLSDPALNRIEARLRARTRELARQPQAIETAPVAHGGWRAFRRYSWQAARYVAAACLILVLVTVGVGRASASSLPGETFYPVKRAIEGGRLAMVSENDEPELRVDLAERRLDEFDALLDRERVYPRVLEEAYAHLNRGLDLLAYGYGDRDVLGPRIITLTIRQARLITQAYDRATSGERLRLQAVSQWNAVIRARASFDELPREIPMPDAVTPDRTRDRTSTYAPRVTPSATPSATLRNRPQDASLSGVIA
jgi:hypothetical protein